MGGRPGHRPARLIQHEAESAEHDDSMVGRRQAGQGPLLRVGCTFLVCVFVGPLIVGLCTRSAD